MHLLGRIVRLLRVYSGRAGYENRLDDSGEDETGRLNDSRDRSPTSVVDR